MSLHRALAVAQTVPVPGDVDANVEQHIALTHEAADRGAQLVLFPELSLTGYELGLSASLAFTSDDSRLQRLREVADERSVSLIVGAPLRCESELHIAAFILSAGRATSVYTKRHLGAFGPDANPGGAVPPAEPTVFRSGSDDPLVTCGTSVAAVAICADVGRPAHAEKAHSRGAKTYLASMFVIPQDFRGEVENLTTYAVRHRMTVAFANYGGPSGGLPSAGRSAIWSDDGACLVQLDERGLGVAVAIETDDGWRVASTML